jgi:hypothetical protein
MAGASAQEKINEAGGKFPSHRGEAASARVVELLAQFANVD